MQWGVEGNQAQGFLQSDRCGDRLSSQAETLNNLFSQRPGVTVTVARERNVSGQTETHTGEESIQNTVTPLSESRNTNFILNVLFAISKKWSSLSLGFKPKRKNQEYHFPTLNIHSSSCTQLPVSTHCTPEGQPSLFLLFKSILTSSNHLAQWFPNFVEGHVGVNPGVPWDFASSRPFYFKCTKNLSMKFPVYCVSTHQMVWIKASVKRNYYQSYDFSCSQYFSTF